MNQQECPPRPGGPEAGRNTEHPNHTTTSDNFKADIEAERRLLALGWLQPNELNDTGYRLVLRSDDFTWIGHGFVYTFICLCAENGITPTIGDCLRLASKTSVELTADQLDNILFSTEILDGELVNYAYDVLRASQKRSEALLRELCRDTLRAVHRGLRIDAEWHCKQINKPARRSTTPARQRRSVARRGGRKAVVYV